MKNETIKLYNTEYVSKQKYPKSLKELLYIFIKHYTHI